MSASLVGSEMCIRDRPWSGPTRPRTCPHRRRGRSPTTVNFCSSGNKGTCLLYTSDAADDM
eukprot:9903135-Alexandrium_andersonii.AAC.1